MRQDRIHQLVDRRHGWTPIALEIRLPLRADGRGAAHLLELAEARRWRLINLHMYAGELPAHLEVKGAIVRALPTDPLGKQLLDLGIPTVRKGQLPHSGDATMPAVMTDRESAARMAAEHFAERDFKHVGYVGRKPWGIARSVYEAFAARSEQLGRTCHLLRMDTARIDAQLQVGEDKWLYRRRAFADWLSALPKPIGLLGYGDLVADMYSQWALEMGLRVPEDVAVMGMGNDETICRCAAVPITSVAYDDHRIAEVLVEQLERLMAGRKPRGKTTRVPPLGVVARQSTDVLAAADPHVASAVQFMWDRITEDVSVDAIAEHVGVSRRTLERAFERDLGRGINQEFQRRRLDKARELILQTDLRIAEIAKAFNFSSPAYFSQAFRAAYGTSPGRYRRQQRQRG